MQSGQQNALFGHDAPAVLPDDDGQFWQTPLGIFYQLQFPVDTCVVDAIHQWLWKAYYEQEEWSLSDFEDYDDMYDDDDFDSDDEEL